MTEFWKPSMLGETAAGQPFELNALKASPLGPGLKDIKFRKCKYSYR